ncbi:hypothetical protein [Methylobacter sp.]|uniref:hypothetical protein n=1 Tax=Methylobacter sp. TaxID=2051955 RepID=UPI003DA478F8
MIVKEQGRLPILAGGTDRLAPRRYRCFTIRTSSRLWRLRRKARKRPMALKNASMPAVFV